jgi:hypothetical protein
MRDGFELVAVREPSGSSGGGGEESSWWWRREYVLGYEEVATVSDLEWRR